MDSLWMITEGAGDSEVIAIFPTRELAVSYIPNLSFFYKWDYYLTELVFVTDEYGGRWEPDWLRSDHMRDIAYE